MQKTVDLADDVLASIRKTGCDFINENDDLISLAHSIDNTSINVNGSSESISLLDDNKPTNSNNPFMTAKQALARNTNQTQKSGNTPQYTGSNSYNPAAQARKMLGAKRRFVDPKSGNETSGGYRDEGRDINTEFR